MNILFPPTYHRPQGQYGRIRGSWSQHFNWSLAW